ncbi:MAG: Gfo/Idh/MocA family oxidoreductase [Armatimonadota bacterium]
MKQLGLHRVDGRSYWFAAYFNSFDRELMVRYAGQARADRFNETFGGQIPFADARIVKVYDDDATAARQFAETFGAEVAESLDAFAEGLDGVIVPFPSGGERRDYEVTAPLARRGIPLFLDRIILEQSELLTRLMAECPAPLHVTCFMRYFADLILPEGTLQAETVVATAHGEPVGYGADLLDLVDELMGGVPVSVLNAGDEKADIARIRYADGRQAILQLYREGNIPMTVTAFGEGWQQTLPIDGSQFHYGAFRQFQAFLRSIETREPAVPYARVLGNTAVLHAIERREFGREIRIGD